MKFDRRILWLLPAAGAIALVWVNVGSSSKSSRGEKGPQDVLVTMAPVQTRDFVDLIEAVGTSKANESVDLTAKSTETIGALHFTDGQRVPAGFIVAELTKREQSADLTSARAGLKEAEQSLRRVQDLAAKGFATKALLEAARAARDGAASKVAAMDSRMSDRMIRTPFAGLLGLRRVSIGTLVRPGDVITTLDDTSQIKVDFTIPEAKLSALKKGGTIRATAAAYPRRKFTGAIDSIDTRVDPLSRSISVRAIIPNIDGDLLPGMLMTIGIESNNRTSLAAPEQSLVPIETKQYVFVVSSEMQAERREVKIGAREPGFVEVLTGIKAGENIVVDGTLRLRHGATVKLAGSEPGTDEKRRKKRQP